VSWCLAMVDGYVGIGGYVCLCGVVGVILMGVRGCCDCRHARRYWSWRWSRVGYVSESFVIKIY
jgi:hypothetical protein